MNKITYQKINEDVIKNTDDYSSKVIKNRLRVRRNKECFSVINRGKLWYDKLTSEQYNELKIWYNDWLDVTSTMIIPKKPTWINNKLEEEDIL